MNPFVRLMLGGMLLMPCLLLAFFRPQLPEGLARPAATALMWTLLAGATWLWVTAVRGWRQQKPASGAAGDQTEAHAQGDPVRGEL